MLDLESLFQRLKQEVKKVSLNVYLFILVHTPGPQISNFPFEHWIFCLWEIKKLIFLKHCNCCLCEQKLSLCHSHAWLLMLI